MISLFNIFEQADLPEAGAIGDQRVLLNSMRRATRWNYRLLMSIVVITFVALISSLLLSMRVSRAHAPLLTAALNAEHHAEIALELLELFGAGELTNREAVETSMAQAQAANAALVGQLKNPLHRAPRGSSGGTLENYSKLSTTFATALEQYQQAKPQERSLATLVPPLQAISVSNRLITKAAEERIQSEQTRFRNSSISATACCLLLVLAAGLRFRQAARERRRHFSKSLAFEEDLRFRDLMLNERIRKQNCLYEISKLVGDHRLPLEQQLQAITDVIPTAWRFHQVACARITVAERTYSTANFIETVWQQSAAITIGKQTVGEIQVCYLEQRPSAEEGPFLKEERALINTIAEQVGLALERVELGNQMRHAQKLEAIGGLTSGIAHDFNNILFAMMGNTELALAATPTSHRSHQKLKDVLAAVERAKDLIKQLLVFAKPTPTERSAIPVQRVVKEVLKLARASLPSTILIEQDNLAENAHVNANVSEIHQVLLNLCANAGHAMESTGGILRVTVGEVDLLRMQFATGGTTIEHDVLNRCPELKPGHYVEIKVEDTGTGMPPEVLKRIFEPFYTTKPKNQGTGLGLHIVKGIVDSLGGSIFADSTPGKGSIFNVYLPVDSPVVEAEMVVEAPVRGYARVLLVDDEESIARMLGSALRELGYLVSAYTDSTMALQAFAERPDAFDVVLTDLTMPQLTGDKLAQRITMLSQDTPVIIMSGNGTLAAAETDPSLHQYEFLSKPVSIRELSLKLSEKTAGVQAPGRAYLEVLA